MRERERDGFFELICELDGLEETQDLDLFLGVHMRGQLIGGVHQTECILFHTGESVV